MTATELAPIVLTPAARARMKAQMGLTDDANYRGKVTLFKAPETPTAPTLAEQYAALSEQHAALLVLNGELLASHDTDQAELIDARVEASDLAGQLTDARNTLADRDLELGSLRDDLANALTALRGGVAA